MKKLLKGLKGKKQARKQAAILALSEPKPVVKVWRGCARTNATLVTLAKRSGTPIADSSRTASTPPSAARRSSR